MCTAPPRFLRVSGFTIGALGGRRPALSARARFPARFLCVSGPCVATHQRESDMFTPAREKVRPSLRRHRNQRPSAKWGRLPVHPHALPSHPPVGTLVVGQRVLPDRCKGACTLVGGRGGRGPSLGCTNAGTLVVGQRVLPNRRKGAFTLVVGRGGPGTLSWAHRLFFQGTYREVASPRTSGLLGCWGCPGHHPAVPVSLLSPLYALCAMRSAAPAPLPLLPPSLAAPGPR